MRIRWYGRSMNHISGLTTTASSTIIAKCLIRAPATNSIVKNTGIISMTVPRSGSSRISTIGSSVRANGPTRARTRL